MRASVCYPSLHHVNQPGQREMLNILMRLASRMQNPLRDASCINRACNYYSMLKAPAAIIRLGGNALAAFSAPLLNNLLWDSNPRPPAY